MKLLNLLEFVSASPTNVDAIFSVGHVHYDNVNGLGATSMGREIAYRGMVTWIRPSKFLDMAAEGHDRDKTAEELESLMKDGVPIAVPFLILSVDGDTIDPNEVKVIGHEGRARTLAFMKLNGPDTYMPVQLHFSGLRAKDLSKEFIYWIETHGITSEGGRTIKPIAWSYYLNGYEYET